MNVQIYIKIVSSFLIIVLIDNIKKNKKLLFSGTKAVDYGQIQPILSQRFYVLLFFPALDLALFSNGSFFIEMRLSPVPNMGVSKSDWPGTIRHRSCRC